MNATVSKKRILILGGGFGGVATARHLEGLSRRRPDVEIVLVSRDNFLLMTPLLFEVFSGPSDLRCLLLPLPRLRAPPGSSRPPSKSRSVTRPAGSRKRACDRTDSATDGSPLALVRPDVRRPKACRDRTRFNMRTNAVAHPWRMSLALVGRLSGRRIVNPRVHRLALVRLGGRLGLESRFPRRGHGAHRGGRRHVVPTLRPHREAVAGCAGSVRRARTSEVDSVTEGLSCSSPAGGSGPSTPGTGQIKCGLTTELLLMSDNHTNTCEQNARRESFVAEPTSAAYPLVLRRGLKGSWIRAVLKMASQSMARRTMDLAVLLVVGTGGLRGPGSAPVRPAAADGGPPMGGMMGGPEGRPPGWACRGSAGRPMGGMIGAPRFGPGGCRAYPGRRPPGGRARQVGRGDGRGRSRAARPLAGAGVGPGGPGGSAAAVPRVGPGLQPGRTMPAW